MKTFGFFLLLWTILTLMTFVNFQDAVPSELIKLILATLITYVFYRLIKEELKD